MYFKLEYNPKILLLNIFVYEKKIDLCTTLKNTKMKDFSDFSIADAVVSFSYPYLTKS